MYYCFFSIMPSLAQIEKKVTYDYRVMFNYTFQIDKEDSTLKISEVMFLQTGPLYSVFSGYNLHLRDSTLEEMSKLTSPPSEIPKRPPPIQVHYKIFKEMEEKQFHYITAFGVKRASYKEELPSFNWHLDETEEMTIAGYLCKKATTSFAGRDYIAWYTPDITLSNGPYKFYGLPGLILSIYDTNKHHVFTATSVVKQSQTLELKKWGGLFLQTFDTKAEFLVYSQTLKDNPALMYQQDLIAVPPDVLEKVVDKIRKGIKKYNNPIEL